ncbi:MAG: ABC transporter ATP-binding protein [Myxococcota bacterium]
MANGEAPVIELEKIVRTYDIGGEVAVRALRSVSLTIAKGESVAIMGPSGSGKSSLMNIIGCLDRPTSGRYLLLGQDVAKLSRTELAVVRGRTLGFVFQSFNLLSRTTAVENVELPLIYAGVHARERRKRAIEALEKVGLGKRLDHRPNQLSGGQQQRVAIARALVGHPPIILADEPTGNLDSQTSREVMAILQSLISQGITLMLVTHEPDIAQYAQRVITLRDGVISEDIRHEPLDAAAEVLAHAHEEH